MECYKNKPTASVNGEVLFTQSVFGKDSGNAKQEFTRINHTVRDASAGVEDGSIEFGCFVNGAVNTFLQINGNENEVNILRNLDMTGNNIRTSTGNMTLDTTTSIGTGIITLNALQSININAGSGSNLSLNTTGGNIVINPSTTGSVVFTGAALQSGTSSGNSGQHLVITLNGVVYKIALQNP